MNPAKLCPKCKKCKKRKGFKWCRLCTDIMKEMYENIAKQHLLKGGTIESLTISLNKVGVKVEVVESQKSN